MVDFSAKCTAFYLLDNSSFFDNAVHYKLATAIVRHSSC